MATKISSLDISMPVSVYCPVCGKIAESCDPEASVVPCDHLLFNYYTEDSRFIHVSASCKEITDRALDAREEYEIDAFSYAVEQLHSKSVLCFSTPFIEGFRHYYAFAFMPVHLEGE